MQSVSRLGYFVAMLVAIWAGSGSGSAAAGEEPGFAPPRLAQHSDPCSFYRGQATGAA